MHKTFVLIFLSVVWGGAAVGQHQSVYFNDNDFKGGYYVVPKTKPAAGEKYWVVALIHGAGGLKRPMGSGMIDLLAPSPVILLVPSFTNGYQSGNGQWAKQMIDHFETITDKHSVHERMFVHGFSGGGQFAHRFTFEEPKYVVACSAHSSGSWACDGGIGTISMKAREIPFFISCGENDTDYSVSGYPHTRIEWYHLFAEKMASKKFVMLGKTWPGKGHGVPGNLLNPHIKELFLLATQGIQPKSEGWQGAIDDLAEKQRAKFSPNSPSSQTSGATTAKLSDRERASIKAANQAISAGRAPDQTATLRFLAKYPASKWADESEFLALKEHCTQIARAYLQQRKSAGGPPSDRGFQSFQQATAGLDLE